VTTIHRPRSDPEALVDGGLATRTIERDGEGFGLATFS